MLELSLKTVSKYYSTTKVLDNVTFDVQTKDRIGLIGRNGTGKTTIFKMIVKNEAYDGGDIFIRKGATIGYLDQIPVFTDATKVNEVIKSAFEKHHKILKTMNELEHDMSVKTGDELEKIMKRYSSYQDQFIAIDGYEMDQSYSKIVEGFEFTEEFLDREFEILSGGEKTTVLLAKILLTKPEILLLDEPSNHLDTTSIHWLEEYLKNYDGAVIAISHDRYFLDNVVNKIVEVEDMRSEEYHGNYEYYLVEKEKRVEIWLENYRNQQKEIKAMEDAIARFKVWSRDGDNEAMVSKIKNMEKRLERVEQIPKPKINRRKTKIKFTSTDRSAKEALVLENVVKAFDDKEILTGLDLDIRFGENVALLGKNGSGKSTIFKIVMDIIEDYAGKKKLGSRVKVAYLDQNVTFDDESMTVLDTYRDIYECKEIDARHALASSLFYSEDVMKKVSSLSGGEKSRLKLCILMNSDVNFLLLDEPTNHLDIDSREMLEAALIDFTGTALFISHDRYFVNKLANRIEYLEDGKIISYNGSYDYFIEKFKLRVEAKNALKLQSKEKEKAIKLVSEIEKSTLSDEKNLALHDKRKPKKKNMMKINILEEELSVLERELEKLGLEIEENASNYELLEGLNTRYSKLEIEVIELMEKLDDLNNI